MRTLRLALRMLRKNPLFSWTAILLLAVGIGAVTTVVTVVDHVLLRALPYPDANRLVTIENGSHSGPFFRRIREFQSVEPWAGAWTSDVNLVGSGAPQRLTQASVTEDFFSLFGPQAAQGRLLQPDDFQSTNAVVVSRGTWQRLWGADPGLVGQRVMLDGEPVLVVGILGDFVLPEALVGSDVDLWRPVPWTDESLTSHEFRALQVVGRLAPGTTHAVAQAELDALMVEMATVHANYRERLTSEPRDLPVTGLADVSVQRVRQGLGLLLGAVMMLLLVACANVANLFLARGLERQQEMSVRRALGASRLRLVEQLMAESLLIGVVGGVIGVVLALVGVRTFLALNPTALPGQASVAVDARVLGLALIISVATAVVFGLLPALRAAGANLASAINSGGRTNTESRMIKALRSGLVVGEVALSLTLIAGAGLMLRSYLVVQGQDLGMDPTDVWTVPVTPTEYDAPEDWARGMEEIRVALAQLPGVASATVGLTLPMEMTGGGRCCWSTRVSVAGEEDGLSTFLHPVGPDYFSTLAVPLVAGRLWSAAEARVAEPAAVVVNEPLARALFGDAATALGQEVGLSFPSVIVGVAADNQHYGAEYEHGPALYLALDRVPFTIPRAVFAVKATRRAQNFAQQAREAIWSVAPSLPVPIVRPMTAMVEEATAGRRFDTALFGSLAGLALLLSSGGLYGLLLYMANRRRRDLAIRMALGAPSGRIVRSMLLGGLGITGLGIVLGLVGAWFTSRLLANRLWGVAPNDPVTLIGAAGLLLATAALASWLPARRAGQIDALAALRED